MKTIGILGGMGPEATADLFVRIIRLVPAARDQDHPRVIIDSNSQIPDRTAAIRGEGPSPLPALVETARNLQRAGAELIAMPCNSAHAWYDEIASAVDVPVLHMIRLTAEETRRRLHRAGAPSPSGPVLLLATTGTITSGLYQRALAALGLEAAVPDPDVQARVMDAIYQVKAGKPAVARSLALDVLVSETARLDPAAVVLGCTELPLVLGPGDLERPVGDSTEVLARAAVQAAFG
ncbi:MAG: amino acid racemase [Firmicutes bacterium]|nr:amino acid racemase [Bacillota bacterium]